MPESRFFVVVTQLKSKGKVDREKSGQLWAKTFSEAEIEAGHYRDTLNYASLEWMGGEWYVVMAVKRRDVERLKGRTKWWNNRVTPDPGKTKGRKTK